MILILEKRKEAGFARLLQAGGATIRPYDPLAIITSIHCCIEIAVFYAFLFTRCWMCKFHF